MTGRERIFNALEGKPVDCVPVVIPYEGILIRDHWETITDIPWHVWSTNDFDLTLKFYKQFRNLFEFDWLHVGFNASRQWAAENKVVVEDGKSFLVNKKSGGKTEIKRRQDTDIVGDSIGKTNPNPDSVLKSIEVQSVEHLREQGCTDLIKRARKEFNDVFLISAFGMPFWHCYLYFGFETLMNMVYSEPGVVCKVCEKECEKYTEWLKAFAEAGVDGIWMEECMTSPDLISPKMFDEFVVQYNKRIITEIRRLGMKSVYYPCGDIIPRMDAINKLSPDYLAFEEPKKDFTNDLKEVISRIDRKICILGNFDAIYVLPNADDGKLKKELEDMLETGSQYKRFVMSLGSPVTPGTSVKRLQKYIRIAREYRQQN